MIMNKKILIAIGIIMLAILYFMIMRGPVISYNKKNVVADTELYKEVGEFYLDDYKSKNCDGKLKYLNVSINDGIPQAECITSRYEHSLNLTDDVYEKYESLYKNFRLDKLSLSCISVYDSFVIFGIESGRASIIYSKDDKKPKYVNGGTQMDKEKDNYIEKITDNLYYGCWQN